MRLAILAAALLALAALPASAAGVVRLRPTPLQGQLVLADGQRYLAAAQGQPSAALATAQLLDIRSGVVTAIAIPPSCQLADLHHATLLWSCLAPNAPYGYAYAKVQNLTTGTSTDLPQLGPSTDPSRSALSSRYLRIGDAWVEGSYMNDHGTSSVYLQRSSGRVTAPTDDGSDFDLDDPELRHRLCRGLERPTVPGDRGFLTQGDLVRHGRRAAVTTYVHGGAFAYVMSQRCGRKPLVLRRCQRIRCSQPVIAGDHIVWSERTRTQPHRSRVVAYSIRTGRRQQSFWHRFTAKPIAVGMHAFVTLRERVYRLSWSNAAR